MDYRSLLDAAYHCQWQAIEDELTQAIQVSPNDPMPLAYAAHVSLRQGQPHRAKALANKSLGLSPNCDAAFIELALVDFYLGEFDKSYQALRAIPLNRLPPEHPAYLAIAYLRVIFDEDGKKFKSETAEHHKFWSMLVGEPELIDAFIRLADIDDGDTTQQAFSPERMPLLANKLIGRGDRLAANLFVKLCQLVAPNSPDSFLAVGIIDLHLGFLESASRALHEAAFRQVKVSSDVLWLTLCLYCRQQRLSEAVDVAKRLIDANAMGLDGIGLYIDLLIRCQADPHTIQNCLREALSLEGANKHPVIHIAALRLSLYIGQRTPDQVLQEIVQTPDLCNSAVGLYLQAELIRITEPARANLLAEQAINLAPFHPDAANWIDPSTSQSTVFEYMGLFLPTEHEGCAWPNQRQTELLQVLFAPTAKSTITRWEEFLVRHHIEHLDAGCYRLLPLLHSRLTHQKSVAQWPKKEMLKGVWKKCFLENSTRLKTIMSLTKTLNEFGINFLILKGLANAVSIYGDLGARPMTDVDILIEPKDVASCHQVLIQLGWQTESQPTKERLRFQYASTYLHPNGGNLDLHWRPAEEFTTDYYDPIDLGAPNAFHWMGQEIQTLCPTTNLACTILHGIAWNHLSPVRWVCDALLLILKEPCVIEWTAFEMLAKRFHFSHITQAGLNFLTRHFPEVKALIPNYLYDSPLTADQEIELNIRCRSRTQPTTLNELLILSANLKQRFNLDPKDQIWACANHLTPQEQLQLSSQGIGWLPVYDDSVFNAEILEKGATNCLVLDGNINGYLKTVCRINTASS